MKNMTESQSNVRYLGEKTWLDNGKCITYVKYITNGAHINSAQIFGDAASHTKKLR
jgi:hypothetical protein